MISQVAGVVVAVAEDRIDVSMGPIALSVLVPGAVALTLKPGAEVTLATSMIVREDSITLYGFADADSRDDFTTLLTVSGVGPRLALSILSAMSPAALRAAISTGNLAALTAVSGVGKKGAERLVVELRDKLPMRTGVAGRPAGVVVGASAPWHDQVRSALLGLGWTARDAQSAVDLVAAETFPDGEAADKQPVAVLLRTALRSLDRS